MVILAMVSGRTDHVAGAISRERDTEGRSIPHLSDARSGVEDLPAPQTEPLSVIIVAPSAEMGDFGANRGNVWDMAESSIVDIVAQTEPFWMERRPASEGTIVRGSTGSQVLAMMFWASSQDTFPTHQYHHLVYRMKIQAPRTCWTNGRVAYARNWPRWYGSQVSSFPFVPHVPPLNCPYGNFCIYYLDLARNNNYPGWPTWMGTKSTTDPSPWLRDPVKAFGIVPNEVCVDQNGKVTAVPEYFDLDFVYLTGDIVARAEDGYRYQLRYDLNAPGAQRVTVTIRYQELHELRPPGQEPPCNADLFANSWKDFNPPARDTINLIAPEPPEPAGENRVFLPVIARATGAGLGKWGYWLDFSDGTRFQDGKSYYLCIEAYDGARRAYRVSSAPVIRVPRSPWFGPN
ncbi:MAG: hypothetical protein DDG58_05460 [Ardenticatenia bacterium]|nr:MAG: hypothetical protein DDG58_05460 [Ardenticatenia bacterium]